MALTTVPTYGVPGGSTADEPVRWEISPADRRRPERCGALVANIGWYQLFANLYRGGRHIHRPSPETVHPISGIAIGESYLIRHEQEPLDEYRRRYRAAFTLPYPREIVQLVTSTLFRQECDRSVVSDALGREYLSDIDLHGHTAREFLRRGFTLAQIYGWVACLTDSYRPGPADLSAYEELLVGGRGYSRWIIPTRLWDWSRDPVTGSFRYAEIWEGHGRWRRWFPDHYELVNADGELVDAGLHELGRVPIDILTCEAVESEDDTSPFGVSAIQDIALLALHVYQMASLLEDHERRSLFAFLQIPTDPIAMRQQDNAVAPNLHLGNSHYLWIGGGGTVSWVEPPESLPREARTQIEWAVREMRNASGVGTRSEESTEAHSGVALNWEYSGRHNIVYERAQNLEDFESRFWHAHASIMGVTIPPDSVRYPSDYAVRPVEQEISEIKDLIDVGQQVPGAVDAMMPLIRRKLARVAVRDVGHLPEIDAILASLASVGQEQDAGAVSTAGPTAEDLSLERDLKVLEQLVKAKAPQEMCRAICQRIAERMGVATEQIMAAITGAEFRWYTEVQSEITAGQTAEEIGIEQP
jgi:hypothetical protein